MLDLSKLEAKAYTLKKEVVMLNELIRDVLKNKEKLFTDKRIQVSFEADDEVELVADYKRMHQVINNLVMNALLHTPEHGKVHICVKKGMFSIDNEGEPIKEEELTLVWEAFYKGEKERARCKRGTGLGLSIVRNVLELHNMSYGVRNTQTGVKFWFEFVNRK